MNNKYILEVRYLDNMNRCRKSSILGVYAKQTDVEKAKENFLNKESKYKAIFSVNIEHDLFHA